jgi:hypothetical protein
MPKRNVPSLTQYTGCSTREALGCRNGWKAKELDRGVAQVVEAFSATQRNLEEEDRTNM